MSEQTIPEVSWCAATAAQQGIWILDRIDRLRLAYLVPSVLEYRGPVDPGLLVTAVRRAVARHPALRSAFRLDVRRRQVTYRIDGPPPEVTYADVPVGGWDPTALRRRIEDRCYAPIDLATGPPGRTEVVRVDGDTTLLVLTVHHIVFDGWSRRLLVQEIAAIYRALLAGREPDLPEPGDPADLPEEKAASRIEAVTERLRGAPTTLPLPYDRSPEGEQPLVSELAEIEFDENLSGQLRTVAAAEGCTPFMAGIAVLAATLARASTQRDFLFGVVWPGRDDPASHRTVGMLMNTVVLRIGLDAGTTWRDLLRSARAGAIDAFVDGDVPLAPIAAALDPDRDVSRPPLTPILVNLADDPGDLDLAPGVPGRYRPLEPTYSIWDMILFVRADERPGPGRMTWSVDYATELFDRSTVTDFLAALRRGATDLTTRLEDPVLEPSYADVDLHDPAARLELVRSVWRQVLVLDDVEDHVGFFEAGGNSLLLVALVEELSRATGRQFRTMEIFRAGNIAGQADLLAEARPAADGRG